MYTEHLSDWNNTLTKFQEAQALLAELETKTVKHQRTIWDEEKRLKLLRYQLVYGLMEQAGLGVCSAEITKELVELHQDMDQIDSLAGKIGLFPVGQLRYLYFKYQEYYSGGEYGSSGYETIEQILRVCPHHFPQKPISVFVNLHYPDWFADGNIIEVVKREDGQFVRKNGDYIFKAPFSTSPLPEAIFEYFQIPPLPDHSTR